MAVCRRVIVGYGSYTYRYESGHSGDACLTGFAVRGIVLWDLRADQLLGLPFASHADGVGELTFAANERALISADGEGTVILWDLDESSWRSRACRIANRNLTYGEWVQFVGNEPYRLTCPEQGVPASLADAGRERATIGDVEGATVLLARAAELGDRSVKNPATEAAALAASALIEKATRLAKSGNIAAAEAAFTRARELAPAKVQDPAKEARRLAAPHFAARGERLARLGRVSDALENYTRALDLDPDAAIDAEKWNTLCVAGILDTRAREVLFACDRAVAGAGESANFFDSRGVARALTGDTKGAVADFEKFAALEQTPRRRAGRPGSIRERRQLDYVARVQSWAAQLRAGGKPFSAEELQYLRSDRP